MKDHLQVDKEDLVASITLWINRCCLRCYRGTLRYAEFIVGHCVEVNGSARCLGGMPLKV